MNMSARFALIGLALFSLNQNPLLAAPTLTHLFPSGAQRGGTVDVVASGTFANWPVKVWVSDPGLKVVPDKKKGTLQVTVKADQTPGVYWLRLYDDSGASEMRPFIVGLLPETAEKEPNDDPEKAQPVERSVVVNGKLSKSGDVDCYSIPLKKGQTLIASLEANNILRSPMDSILQIVSSEGYLLEQNHDERGLDPQATYTAPADGVYVVRIFAFPSQPNSTIRFFGSDLCIYRLTLANTAYTDFVTPLAVSREKPGSLHLHGWNIPDAQRVIPTPPIKNDNALSLVLPGFANAVTVPVEPHACLDLTTTPLKEPTTAPFSATAILARPNAAVVVPFSAMKGKLLQLQVQSRSLDLPVNPSIRVLDASDKVVAQAAPKALNTDCEVNFNPPSDGIYRVEVRDLYDAGGPRYAFLLRATVVKPDYDLTVTGDHFTAAAGKEVTVPFVLAVRGGFKETVAYRVIGLPEGVDTKTEITKGKGTLKFTPKAPFSGSIQVEGFVKGKPEFTRIATTKSATFDVETPHLFLSVTKAGK